MTEAKKAGRTTAAKAGGQTKAATAKVPTTEKQSAAKKPAPARSSTAAKPAVRAKPAAAAKPSRPRAKKPAGVAPEQRLNYIEVAAYYIAARRGFAPGDPLQDWVQAEAEIDRLLSEGRLGTLGD